MSEQPATDLITRKCQPCEGGVAALSLSEARTLMQQLAGEWQLAPDGKSIRREWKFRNFYHAMSFVNAVAHIANTEDHHPDIEAGYGYCRLKYSTHAIGGLSDNDFICAAKVDAIP
jgi:4a-hydroxytetrahydrobiopterin dehydratase